MDLAMKEGAILDRRPGRAQVAVDFGTGVELDPALGRHRSAHFAADHNGRRRDIGRHVGARVNRDHLPLRLDAAIDTSGYRERLLRRDFAFDDEGGTGLRGSLHAAA